MAKLITRQKGMSASLSYLERQSYLLPEKALFLAGSAAGQEIFRDANDTRSFDEKYESLIESSYGKDLRDAAISGALTALATFDPTQAIEKINKLSDATTRDVSISAVLKNENLDVSSAISLAESISDKDQQENAILNTLSKALLKNNKKENIRNINQTVNNSLTLDKNKKEAILALIKTL